MDTLRIWFGFVKNLCCGLVISYSPAEGILKLTPDYPAHPLTRLQLAELLLEHYPEERAEALDHLNFAIAEFREMKMQPSLERALGHNDILGA